MDIISYTVRPGNTLWGIGNFFGVAAEDLAALNDIEFPYTIYPGQVIKIVASEVGTPSFYTVRPGDTLWNIAQRYALDLARILQLNNIDNPDAIYPGQIIRLG